ncbi:MAG: ZIP family metal transporter [Clostridiaceae bacterium]|nr:ZIP family metal transporter [Clostridiaceae bacterium]
MLAAGLLIPFAGTMLGSAMVFFMRNKIHETFEKFLLGFAAGVMLAASIWSLMLPSIEMADNYTYKFIPAALGFLLGIGFLLVLDTIIPHLHVESKTQEGLKGSKLKNATMMVFAVTLHNIPEGMVIGVTLAAALNSSANITFASVMVLAAGIALQNFPEGAIISMPLKSEGVSKIKAFLLGTLSGAVEPIFGLLTVLLTSIVITALPYLLSFAAGAMVYVVVEELIPDSQTGKHSNIATIGLAIGFVIMMILDIYFG